MSFQGFDPEGLTYLMEVRMRDSREWYNDHKELYRRTLLNPMKELIVQLGPTMNEIDPQIVCRPDRGISRIRRDTRFTKDKHLYRDSMWITLKRQSNRMEYPCFFFELTPVFWRFGMGFSWLSPRTMQSFRDAFQARENELIHAIQALGTRTGIRLYGNTYRKDHYPQLEPPLKDWCNHRDLYLAKESEDLSPLWNPDLPLILCRGFKRLKPLYDFLWSILESNSETPPNLY